MSRLAVSIIVIIVTVHTHAHAAVLFADDFESGVVNPSWTVVEGFEVIADPTGDRPAFVASPTEADDDNVLIKDLPIVPGTTVRGFFYENGAEDGDENAFGFDRPTDSISIVVRSSSVTLPSSFGFYLFDPLGGEVFTTNIERTVGWHEFRLEVTSSETNAFIDGTLLGSSPITTFDLFFLVSETPGGNPVYWDDICIFTGDGASCFQTNVDIDIKPGSDPNGVNPRSKGVIPVAVLGSEDFDATQVDFTTVAFGPGGAAPVHDGHVEDVNSDGFADMVFHFKIAETGIACGDIDATLTGESSGGDPFEATDAVKTAGCK